MKLRLRWLPVLLLAAACGPLAAAPVGFGENPIGCTDPVGATVPIACAETATPRSDGYSFVGYSFFVAFPLPGVPPPPFPQEARNDSERDFDNPILQDLMIRIFGDTKVDVDGAPVQFFVQGTLDGEVVVEYTATVSGHDNHMSWNFGAVIDDVPAGDHTLDMHFGVRQLANNPSQVNVASLYRITVNDVPEPSTLALLLAAGCLAAGARLRSGWRG